MPTPSPAPSAFHRATITRIVRETADTSTFALAPHSGDFSYRAGQFCAFRVRVDGRDLLRSYSMSSAPETDGELTTTVKRVRGGKVSNWLNDHAREGDELELTQPRGRFCLRETDAAFLGFAGGSGITPVFSLAKSALAGTGRRVRLLCADRTEEAMIFGSALDELRHRYPDRLTVVRHCDATKGLLRPADVKEFVGTDGDADAYVCGPEPFMELVESALPGGGQVFSERFAGTAPAAPSSPPSAGQARGTITIRLGGRRVAVPAHPGETLLQTARRAGLTPPFSCEAGNCATCMARVTEGSVRMRVNDVLEEDEVAEGYVLTCQGVPETPSVAVEYE